MCGLFGYTGTSNKRLNELLQSLARESTQRGTDATGIAYNTESLRIFKRPKSALELKFKVPFGVNAVLGHTRHATQGDKNNNFNNHPFYGKAGLHFALAHNGVIFNDTALQKDLSKTKVETDSYVAVQLIEHMEVLNMKTLKHMAEKLEGSFAFSILDEENNTYLVKGDSPLSLLFFPSENLYVYASTDKILLRALIESPLLSSLKTGSYEQIPIAEGDILKISKDGILSREKFECKEYEFCGWWKYGTHNSYLDDLKSVGACMRLDPDEIQTLYESGLDPYEIEELMYQSDFWEV